MKEAKIRSKKKNAKKFKPKAATVKIVENADITQQKIRSYATGSDFASLLREKQQITSKPIIDRDKWSTAEVGYKRSESYLNLMKQVRPRPPLTDHDWFDGLKPNSIIGAIFYKFAGGQRTQSKSVVIKLLQDCGLVYTSSSSSDTDHSSKSRCLTLKELKHLLNTGASGIVGQSGVIDFSKFMNTLDEIATRLQIAKEHIYEKIIGAYVYGQLRIKRQEALDVQSLQVMPELNLSLLLIEEDNRKEPVWKRAYRKDFQASLVSGDLIGSLRKQFDKYCDKKGPSGKTKSLLSQQMVVVWIRESNVLPSLFYSVDVDGIYCEALSRNNRTGPSANINTGVNFEEFLWILEQVCIRISIEPVKQAIRRLLKVDYLDDVTFMNPDDQESYQMKAGISLADKINQLSFMSTVERAWTIINLLQEEASQSRKLQLTETERNRLRALFKTFADHAYRRITSRPGAETRLTGTVCVQWFRECFIFDDIYTVNMLDKDFKFVIGDFQRKGTYSTTMKDIDFEGFLALIELISLRKNIKPNQLVKLLFEGPLEPSFRLLENLPVKKATNTRPARK